MPKIVVLGGGTGSFVVLSGLKNFPIKVFSIVTMMDSGGSTGRLRDQLGVLPPGDFRQCLVALSEADILWRKLFLYRFEAGDLAGHNFGNIFISALEKICKNYDEVVKYANYILKVKGEVIPVTYEKTHLEVTYDDGSIVRGEGLIDQYKGKKKKISEIRLVPQVKANLRALKLIKESQLIVIGPGDIYTSILPIFLVKGIKQSIKESKAKLVYIVNLMTKIGQTHNFKASDHLKVIEKYLGKTVDIVVINNGKIPKKILKWYKAHQEEQVEDDLKNEDQRIIIRSDLISRKFFIKTKADILSRSVLRHSSLKLAKLIYSLI